MRIFVHSRPGIEVIPASQNPHAFISITTTPGDQARLKIGPACRGVLRLSFPDQDIVLDDHPERELFSEAQALEVWRFVDEHADHIDELYLHCDAGHSRSPAVAAAITRDRTGDDSELFRRFRPNMRVYRILLEVRAGSRAGDVR